MRVRGPVHPSTLSGTRQCPSVRGCSSRCFFFQRERFSWREPGQLTLGAVGTLSWAAYVSPRIRLGAEIGGNFTLDPNSNVLLMLPLVLKASYIFTFYPFEVPVSLGAGMNIVHYTSLTDVDLLLRPGASFYWIYNSSWSFGVNLVYWFDMQFNTNPALTRYGNFAEFSLSALYHF